MAATALKDLAKRAAHASGLLAWQHRRAHGPTLTATMLHRVLPEGDPRWAEADPYYVLGAAFFEQVLDFFARHYNIVSLADVAAAAAGGPALPPRAMLITFDDGWADNLEVAAPILRRRGMPAVVFLATSAIAADESTWWQERLFGAARDPDPTPRTREALAALQAATGADDPLVIAARLSEGDPAARERLIADLPVRESGRRMMLKPGELRALVDAGIALGVHGHSHAPLSLLADPGADLAAARRTHAGFEPGLSDWAALACPHGRYDDRVIAAAGAQRFRFVFTSDPHINAVPRCFDGGLAQLGRITVDQPIIAGRDGRLDESKLAIWLWRREVR